MSAIDAVCLLLVVELVRQYYGFADEDLDEKRRVEFLESFYDNGKLLFVLNERRC